MKCDSSTVDLGFVVARGVSSAQYADPTPRVDARHPT